MKYILNINLQPPMRRPPVNIDKVKPLSIEIEFSVTEIVYDDNLLDAIIKVRKPKKKVKYNQFLNHLR